MKLGLKVSKDKQGQKNKLDENSSWHKRLRRSRLLAFVPFLILATLIWIVQTLQSDVIRPVYIPLGLREVSKSNGTKIKIPEFIEVQVKDKGIEHIRYELDTPDTIQLHLIQEHDGTEYIGILRRELSEALTTRVSSTATVVQTSFSELKIATHKRIQKKLPIVLGNKPEVPMGYTIEKITLSPDSVLVYGEASRLAQLQEIRTEVIKDSLSSTGISRKLKLKLPYDTYSDFDNVQVKITLEELTERSYNLPIQIEHVPEGFTIIPLPSTADVTITLPRSRYNDVSEANLTLSADFRSLTSNKDVLRLRLSKKPQWIIQTRIMPETIQYIKEGKREE